MGFPGVPVVKNPPDLGGDSGDTGSVPGLGRDSRGGNDNRTPVFLPSKPHGQRNRAGYSTHMGLQRVGHD